MKKMIILVGIVFSLSATAQSPEKVMMDDYLPVPDRDFAFEVKTKVFEKVVLDCGGFVGWMTFYRDGKIAHNVYLDTYSDCPNMHDFLSSSHENKRPVCMQVEGKSIMVSNEPDDCL